MPKDNFSGHSASYARYRPTYPIAMIEYIAAMAPNLNHAWDCATGNGQVAWELAKSFKHVDATDISVNQLANASFADNIEYLMSPAEKTPFPDQYFDLITVAQALHWFKFNNFFDEVRRVSKPDGIIAIWGYEKSYVNEAVDEIILDFYSNVVGEFWDIERQHIENMYRNIAIPFQLITSPDYEITMYWDLNNYIGYIGTWSAVQHYKNIMMKDPIPMLKKKLIGFWPDLELRMIKFPIFLRLANVHC